MTIQFKYYKATGEKAEAVKTKIIEAHHNTVHARRELMEKISLRRPQHPRRMGR